MVRPSSLGPVYLVTDRRETGGRDLEAVVEAALRGGVRAVQLRERDLSTCDLLALATRLRALTSEHGALLLVNDRVDVALACGADGVHLPASSFAVPDARALLGPRRLIGVSTHHPNEVVVAAESGADFAVFGPIHDTPSKRPYGPPLGLAALRQAAAASIPVYAIGGIDAARATEARRSGAAGVAVVRAILAAADPAAAAARLAAATSA